jgi:membrane protein implicated in regulation of membrane protease activity
VQRARRHHRLLSALAFGLLALVAELAGRSLAHRIDVGRHVSSPSYSGTDYYPFLLAAVKLGVALLAARLVWRFVRARAAARAGHRVLTALGKSSGPAPRVKLELSPRLWLAAFTVTSIFALIHFETEQAASGRWGLLWPWLHTSALPVFAILSVFVALAWSAVSRWLNEYERYALDTCARAGRLAAATERIEPQPRARVDLPPRKLFGLAFECRPPPLTA